MITRVARDLLLAASGWIALAFALEPFEPMRVISTFLFVFACPGLAIVGLTNITGRVETFVVAVALSLSIATITTETLAIFHKFDPVRSLVILSSVTTLAVIAQRVRPEAGRDAQVVP